MPWNQAATSIGNNNSYVYPITVPNFKRLDYGPADFDHRNVFATSYVYTIPKVLNDAPSVARYIVNGWSTTGLIQYRSGDPLTIFANSGNIDGSQQSRDRAVYPGGGAYGSTTCAVGAANCKSWLNHGRLLEPRCRRLRKCREGLICRAALRGLGRQHRSQVPVQRTGQPDVPRRVLQPVQPHQPWRSQHHLRRLGRG